MNDKPKLALYWASSCGGCEISVVNLHERLLAVDDYFDFVFCPCLLDTKKKDVEAMADGGIAVTLFNGAIRTAENEEMAVLLRKKSRLLVAFGSCAAEGCIPALSNLSTAAEHFRSVYINNPTVVNPDGIIPQPEMKLREGVIRLPAFYEKVMTLGDVVSVDYYMPGCPPESTQIWSVLETIIGGGALPPAGAVIGAGATTVCEECARIRTDKKIDRFFRIFEKDPDRQQCLLEQGLICMGIATRCGCGALCPQVNMPCTGCYGPSEQGADQGGRMVGALGAIIDIERLKGMPEESLPAVIDGVLDHVPDYAGTFYKYSLAASILKGRVKG